jgi:hypothetical protein
MVARTPTMTLSLAVWLGLQSLGHAQGQRPARGGQALRSTAASSVPSDLPIPAAPGPVARASRAPSPMNLAPMTPPAEARPVEQIHSTCGIGQPPLGARPGRAPGFRHIARANHFTHNRTSLRAHMLANHPVLAGGDARDGRAGPRPREIIAVGVGRADLSPWPGGTSCLGPHSACLGSFSGTGIGCSRWSRPSSSRPSERSPRGEGSDHGGLPHNAIGETRPEPARMGAGGPIPSRLEAPRPRSWLGPAKRKPDSADLGGRLAVSGPVGLFIHRPRPQSS